MAQCCVYICVFHDFNVFFIYGEVNGPIYRDHRDGSSVWTNLDKEKIVRLIVRVCINAGKQDGSFVKTNYLGSSSIQTSLREYFG